MPGRERCMGNLAQNRAASPSISTPARNFPHRLGSDTCVCLSRLCRTGRPVRLSRPHPTVPQYRSRSIWPVTGRPPRIGHQRRPDQGFRRSGGEGYGKSLALSPTSTVPCGAPFCNGGWHGCAFAGVGPALRASSRADVERSDRGARASVALLVPAVARARPVDEPAGGLGLDHHERVSP